MSEWSLFSVRLKSSAADQLHINTPGKANFKHLHFEISEFSLKTESEARDVPMTMEHLTNLRDSLNFHVKPPKTLGLSTDVAMYFNFCIFSFFFFLSLISCSFASHLLHFHNFSSSILSLRIMILLVIL